MHDLRFFFRSLEPELEQAWKHHFAGIPEVESSTGSIFDLRADAIVPPANSFGDMTGGIDRIYSQRFGWDLQARLQALLRSKYDGELLVGQAEILPTNDPEIPLMISAPTMRVPLKIADTVNAFLAFRAVIRAIQSHNAQSESRIRSVLCPGLGTGTGEMPPEVCARQMHAAYRACILGTSDIPQTVNDALVAHYRLIRP